jgi:MFS family permease
MAVFLAHLPGLQHVGLVFLAAVAGFGLVMIGFGLSHVFWLSLLLLSLFGALDSLSMVVRDVLMLTSTPDAMRGRVAAIEGVCTSASNQLGGLESGVTAQLFGPVVSVVGGGIATIGRLKLAPRQRLPAGYARQRSGGNWRKRTHQTMGDGTCCRGRCRSQVTPDPTACPYRVGARFRV